MKVEIKKIAQVGNEPKFQIFIDEKEYGFGFQASRKLTSTTDENGAGVFTSGIGRMHRNGAYIQKGENFQSCYPKDEDSAADVANRIADAVNEINRKFAEKYPAVSESAIITI